MNRVELIPDRQIATDVKRLMEEMEHLKDVQPMGADMLVPKVTQTPNAYDLESHDDGFGDQIIEIGVLLYVEHQLNPNGSLNVKLYDLTGNELPQSEFIRVFLTPRPTWPNSGSLRCEFYAQRAGANPFRCKFFMLGTDTGSLAYYATR